MEDIDRRRWSTDFRAGFLNLSKMLENGMDARCYVRSAAKVPVVNLEGMNLSRGRSADNRYL